MFNKYLNDAPQLRYPLSAQNLNEKDSRSSFVPQQSMVLKSAIRDRVRFESEAANDLLDKCTKLVTSHGFIFNDGTCFPAKKQSETAKQLKQWLEHPLIGKKFQESDVYKGYLAYREAHPMRSANDVAKLMQEVSRISTTLYHQHYGIEIGERGEETVSEYLERFEGRCVICKNVLLNARIKINAETSESDICIITEWGIVVCEIKNKYSRGGKKIKISKDGRWEEIDIHTRHSTVPSKSPISQNVDHCLSIQQFLDEHGFGFVPVMPVIIIANDTVDIENYSLNRVVRKEELYNIIHTSRRPVCLNRGQMEEIAHLLQSDQVEERSFPVETIGEISNTILTTLEQYLDDYDRECDWDEALTRAMTKHAETMYQTALEEETEAKTANTRGLIFLTGIFALLGLVFYLLTCTDIGKNLSRAMELMQYSKDGTSVFANVFDDTVVLTAWPLDEYNGETANSDWREISNGGAVRVYNDGSPMDDNRITNVIILDDLYPASTSDWFHGMQALHSIEGLDKLHTDNVTDISGMFEDCRQLQTIDLSDLNLSNVTDTSNMFQNCLQLQSINFGIWNASEVTSLSYMFNGCPAASTIDFSGWDLSSAEDLTGMFANIQELHSIDLSGWNVSNVANLSGMFSGCYQLQYINFSDWNVSNVADFTFMFDQCYALQSVDLSCWDISNATDLSGMFQYCEQLGSIDLADWNVSNVTDFNSMFAGCSQLKSLDIANWNVSNAITFYGMFAGCSQLEHLDIADWDVSNVQNFDDMFAGCDSLGFLPWWYPRY